MNAVLTWLGEPVELLGFNWVGVIACVVAFVVMLRLARWSAYRHPVSWERPMTRVSYTPPPSERQDAS